MERWVGQCIKYELFFPKVHFVLILQLGCQCIKYELFFPKVHFFLILKLCLAPVFNFFPLSDLKYNLSQISEKIGFFREKSDFFGKMLEFFRFFPKNRQFFAEIFLNDFSMVFSSPLQPITEKSSKYRPIFPIFSSLCVPTFKVNLMSVSRLTRDLNCSMTFFPHWCVLQDLATRRMIGLGKQRDGLYYLAALTTRKIGTTSHSSPNHQPTCNLTTSSTDLWHSRLGHISHSRLSFIAKNFLKFSI